MQVWLKRALNVYRKFGPTVRFATKLILGVVIPGSPMVIDLIDDETKGKLKPNPKTYLNEILHLL